jgi:death-on-curing protein
MELLQKKDVILINRLTIEDVGGNFVPPQNFLHESNLDYLIEAVDAEMFGDKIYPTIVILLVL